MSVSDRGSGVDRAAPFAAERGFVAGFLAHLIPGRQGRKFAGDAAAMDPQGGPLAERGSEAPLAGDRAAGPGAPAAEGLWAPTACAVARGAAGVLKGGIGACGLTGGAACKFN